MEGRKEGERERRKGGREGRNGERREGLNEREEGGKEWNRGLERRLQGWNQLGQERLPPPALWGPRGRAPVTT